jgi:hypothetical protein
MTLSHILQKIIRTPHIWVLLVCGSELNGSVLTVVFFLTVTDRMPGIHRMARRGTINSIHRVMTDALIR